MSLTAHQRARRDQRAFESPLEFRSPQLLCGWPVFLYARLRLYGRQWRSAPPRCVAVFPLPFGPARTTSLLGKPSGPRKSRSSDSIPRKLRIASDVKAIGGVLRGDISFPPGIREIATERGIALPNGSCPPNFAEALILPPTNATVQNAHDDLTCELLVRPIQTLRPGG